MAAGNVARLYDVLSGSQERELNGRRRSLPRRLFCAVLVNRNQLRDGRAMKSRNAWLGLGLGANSTTLGDAPPARCLRLARGTFAFGAQSRGAAVRSFLLEPVLVVVVLRPSASAGGAVAAEPAVLTDCEPLGPGTVTDLETSEAADGAASLDSGAAELAENVVNGHMRLPT
jgi:X-X-X-Leu-X-X-Gly heptad repeat protein